MIDIFVQVELASDDCEAKIVVKHTSKLIPMKQVPITLGHVYVDADFQLLFRFGSKVRRTTVVDVAICCVALLRQ